MIEKMNSSQRLQDIKNLINKNKVGDMDKQQTGLKRQAEQEPLEQEPPAKRPKVESMENDTKVESNAIETVEDARWSSSQPNLTQD